MKSSGTYIYKEIEDLEIRADLYAGSGDGPRPTILFMHGGALIAGNRWMILDDQLELLTGNGYNLISIDYRLAPETKLASIIGDTEDAWRWIHAEADSLLVDVDRLAVMGSSAGGYLTLTAGFRFQPRPRALVSLYGYGDLTGPWYSQPSPHYLKSPAVTAAEARSVVGEKPVSCPGGPGSPDRGKFYLYCRQMGIWPEQVSGHDSKDADWFADFEPLRNVTNEYPPTILLHGEVDTDVPFEQSVMMKAALEANDVPNMLISRPYWNHGFDGAGLKDPQVSAAFERVMAFLGEHLI